MAKDEKQGLLEKLVPILLIASIVLAFFVGVLWQKVGNLESGNVSGTQSAEATPSAQKAAGDASKISIDQIKDLFKKDLIKFGDADRKVLFVQISDPSCPFCNLAAGKNPDLNKQIDENYKKQWLEQYPGEDPEKNTNKWKRFTLVSDGGTYVAPVGEMKRLVDSGQASYVYIYQNGHGAGEMAQKAMYCAYEQNKFWEVHDLLMSANGYNLINNTVKNDKTKSQELADFLKSAADPGKMKTCLDSGKYDERIAGDMELAKSLGIGGTPGFFVNTKNFAGAFSFKEMESTVAEALK